MGEGMWSMVSSAGALEKAILVILAVCSVILWSMVFLKIPEIRAAKRNGARFMDLFRKADSFGSLKEEMGDAGESVQAAVFLAALDALKGKAPGAGRGTASPDDFRVNPERSTEEIVLLGMQHTSAAYFAHMQRGLNYMATIGSTTPFIGLFGTVVGIMTTFYDLGTVKTPSMQVVAPGISGALVATAAGLAVAIPAVIACNWFNGQIDDLREQADAFIEKMMALIRANAPHAAVPAADAPQAPAKKLATPTPKHSPAVRSPSAGEDGKHVPSTPAASGRPLALADKAAVGATKDSATLRREAKP